MKMEDHFDFPEEFDIESVDSVEAIETGEEDEDDGAEVGVIEDWDVVECSRVRSCLTDIFVITWLVCILIPLIEGNYGPVVSLMTITLTIVFRFYYGRARGRGKTRN